MAEIGGSPTDDSIINLDATESEPSSSNQPQKEGAPSTSNQQQKEGLLKRPADLGNNEPVQKKKKKISAEEMASTTKGRNVELKKKLRKEKEQKRKQERNQQKGEFTQEELLNTRDRLVARLKELGERDMCMSDRAEEKALKKEETFRNALKSCERALRSEDEGSFDEEEQNVFKSLSIHIPEWPCLDNHVQDFALERYYAAHHQEKGVALRRDDLIDIINKVKSRDSTTGLPSVKDNDALDRILTAINYKVVEAVHERRFEELQKNLEEYPGVDPELEVEPVLRVKQEVGDGRDELKEAVGRIMTAYGDETGSEAGIDFIELNDDDEDKEGDDDELDDNVVEDVEGEEEEKDEDINFVRRFEEHSSQREKETMDEVPEMDLTEDEETLGDKQTKDVSEKKTEDRPDSGDGKEIMAMEGGTSTNSPTEADELMISPEDEEMEKELNNIYQIKQEVHLGPRSNSNIACEDEEGGEEGGEGEADTAPDVIHTYLGADSVIVLDDDDDEDDDVPAANVQIKKEEETDKGGPSTIGPPQSEQMNLKDAWRAKVKEIQLWVNNLTPSKVMEFSDTMKEEEEEQKAEMATQPIVRLVEIEDEDDDIVCDLDDFEMDSVSHSGLQIRKQQKLQEEAPPAKEEPDDEVEVIELD